MNVHLIEGTCQSEHNYSLVSIYQKVYFAETIASVIGRSGAK